MPLKSRTKTFIHVDSYDFDQFVREVYGHEFTLAADQESADDVSHEFHVEPGEFYVWDQEKLEKFKKTGSYYLTAQVLLTDLCNRGLIEPGDYIIAIR